MPALPLRGGDGPLPSVLLGRAIARVLGLDRQLRADAALRGGEPLDLSEEALYAARVRLVVVAGERAAKACGSQCLVGLAALVLAHAHQTSPGLERRGRG